MELADEDGRVEIVYAGHNPYRQGTGHSEPVPDEQPEHFTRGRGDLPRSSPSG